MYLPMSPKVTTPYKTTWECKITNLNLTSNGKRADPSEYTQQTL